MKETILTILQERMNKCTSEQFWAVGLITGLDAFVFMQYSKILDVFPKWSVIFLCVFIGALSIYYVIDRHKNYYNYHKSFVSLVKEEPDVPLPMKSEKKPWDRNSLIGTGFYIGWLVLVTVAVFFRLF